MRTASSSNVPGRARLQTQDDAIQLIGFFSLLLNAIGQVYYTAEMHTRRPYHCTVRIMKLHSAMNSNFIVQL